MHYAGQFEVVGWCSDAKWRPGVATQLVKQGHRALCSDTIRRCCSQRGWCYKRKSKIGYQDCHKYKLTVNAEQFNDNETGKMTAMPHALADTVRK